MAPNTKEFIDYSEDSLRSANYFMHERQVTHVYKKIEFILKPIWKHIGKSWKSQEFKKIIRHNWSMCTEQCTNSVIQ